MSAPNDSLYQRRGVGMRGDVVRVGCAETGPCPTGQAASRLDASRCDPARDDLQQKEKTMPADDWKIAPIWIQTTKGWYEIPGWTNGMWCLDWRAFYSSDIDDIRHVFAVTHTLTGFTACSVVGSLIEAQAFVAHLAAAADWNFTAASEAKDRATAFAEAKAKFAIDHPKIDIVRGNTGAQPNSGGPAHSEPSRALAA